MAAPEGEAGGGMGPGGVGTEDRPARDSAGHQVQFEFQINTSNKKVLACLAQNSGHGSTIKVFLVYLKFRVNPVSCIFIC